jgi:hypothetical protein
MQVSMETQLKQRQMDCRRAEAGLSIPEPAHGETVGLISTWRAFALTPNGEG